MYETLFYLALGLAYILCLAAWELAKWLWQGLQWLWAWIQEGLVYEQAVADGQRKEDALLAAHQQSMRELEETVANVDQWHRDALVKPDCQPSRRQSGQRSGDI